ncbi:hypothetical protein [Brachybacterium sp. FME24]|uniref:hypothetical protein n=1 Tax=Brachybacterium sp. FME24 TaxID=2742605 RepID=UPI00186733E0|nr:hypothetical protein [Brachybacterium sp. FME24]
MSAPIYFWGFDRDGYMLATVGKSTALRPIEITRKQAVEIICALARDIGEDTP